MKEIRKWMLVLACAVLAAGCMAFVGCGGSEDQEQEAAEATEATEATEAEVLTIAEADVPDDVQALIDEVKGYADQGAQEVGAEFGDKYRAMLESGEGDKYQDFSAMKEQLDGYREKIGATYVYALSPMGPDGEPFLDGDGTEHFLITVDGSEDPDPWGEDYDWEVQFKEAWLGEVAAARSAWADEDDTDLCWSAFAPIKDSQGKVVGILGVDYPADVILDYPEWNRDSDKWNKIEE